MLIGRHDSSESLGQFSLFISYIYRHMSGLSGGKKKLYEKGDIDDESSFEKSRDTFIDSRVAAVATLHRSTSRLIIHKCRS